VIGAFGKVALRDVAIALVTALLLFVDAGLRASGDASFVAHVVGAAAGSLLTLSAFLVHEWGHWIAAVASGARVSRPPRKLSPYLFFYDTARSTRAQFLWMSFGGYLATAIALAGIVAWADLRSTSGLVAVGLSSLGMLVTFVLEVPTTWRVWRGRPLPTGGVYTS
jgi:hypothetical protein